MAARFIIEGDIPTDRHYRRVPMTVTVRRRDGVNGTVTLTYARLPDIAGSAIEHWAWVLTGEVVPPAQHVSGYDSYNEYDGGDHWNVSAMRAAKALLLGLKPGAPLVKRRPKDVLRSAREAERKARIRESKRAYMERWREANPDLAREQTREAVRAHRARKRAAEHQEGDVSGLALDLRDEAMAGKCLTCGFVGPAHYLLYRSIPYDMRRHYRAEHPGVWEGTDGPHYEQVSVPRKP